MAISEDLQEYLEPTEYIESEHPDVIALVESVISPEMTQIEKAIAIYYKVRDGIIYNPYVRDFDRESFKASYILKTKKSFCIPKAILLAAGARAAGIPSRLGFANVKNHLTSKKLQSAIKSDIVAFHGYTEMFLEGKWVKSTPAFHARLCRVFGIKPLEFDGRQDSIFHEFSMGGAKHMEYLEELGEFADMPFERMWDEYRK